MTFKTSPGVYPNIIDDSQNAVYTNPNIAAMVGGHTRGPLGPFLTTTIRNRQLFYGQNYPAWGHLIDTSDAFLLQGTQAYIDRVVSADAMYGLGLICNNVVAGVPQGTTFTTIPGGSAVPYSEVNRGVFDLEASAVFVQGDSVEVTINGTSTPSIAFNTNHNTTMMLIEQAVQNVLDGLEDGGLAWLVPIGTNDMILRVVSPQAITLEISATVTGSSKTLLARSADWLGFVVAQNPGDWSCPNGAQGYPGVAVGITNVDVGTPQRLRIGLSSAVLTGQSLTMVANGTTVTVPFNINNNQTLQDFCGAIMEAFPGSSAQLAAPVAGSNNLVVNLTAASASESLAITTLQVSYPNGFTGARGTVPVVTFTQTLTPVPSSGTFSLAVYENNNFVTPNETYLCTYAPGTDGTGAPTGIDYVINGIDATTNVVPLVPPSSRIAMTINPLFSGTVNGPTSVTNSNLERYLGGGANGSIPSTQQIVTGWNDFASPEVVTIRLLLNAGYATPEVHQKMMAISSSRQDCFSVLDTPSNLQAAADAANYRQNVMNVNNFWGAVYSPDILIYDPDLGVRRFVPPSGQVGAQYAYNDRVASSYFAPAGLTRGVLANALGCRFKYEEGDRDVLSQAQVNGIRFIDDAWTIWGEYTLQTANSALSSVPVVRMIIEVITEAASAVAYSVFEPNNPYTWNRVTTLLNGILQPIEDAEGITDFTVQCNASNNTTDVIAQRVMKVAMWIKPVLCALYIQLDAIVTRQNAVFSVEETATNNAY